MGNIQRYRCKGWALEIVWGKLLVRAGSKICLVPALLAPAQAAGLRPPEQACGLLVCSHCAPEQALAGVACTGAGLRPAKAACAPEQAPGPVPFLNLEANRKQIGKTLLCAPHVKIPMFY